MPESRRPSGPGMSNIDGQHHIWWRDMRSSLGYTTPPEHRDELTLPGGNPHGACPAPIKQMGPRHKVQASHHDTWPMRPNSEPLLTKNVGCHCRTAIFRSHDLLGGMAKGRAWQSGNWRSERNAPHASGSPPIGSKRRDIPYRLTPMAGPVVLDAMLVFSGFVFFLCGYSSLTEG